MTKPAMAWPSFASATYTFAPPRLPGEERESFDTRIAAAHGRTAGGVAVRQAAGLSERVVTVTYGRLTTRERDSFAAPDGTGFFHAVGAGEFEYRDSSGTVHRAVFESTEAPSAPAGFGLWRLGPIRIELL